MASFVLLCKHNSEYTRRKRIKTSTIARPSFLCSHCNCDDVCGWGCCSFYLGIHEICFMLCCSWSAPECCKAQPGCTAVSYRAANMRRRLVRCGRIAPLCLATLLSSTAVSCRASGLRGRIARRCYVRPPCCVALLCYAA